VIVEVQRLVGNGAGTKIHLGHAYREKIVTVIIEDSQFRILHDGTQLSASPRTVIKEVTRRSASGHITYPGPPC
jgi:hypothetical protein